jgi:hypothetical protein
MLKDSFRLGLMKKASKFRLVLNNELGVIWKKAA